MVAGKMKGVGHRVLRVQFSDLATYLQTNYLYYLIMDLSLMRSFTGARVDRGECWGTMPRSVGLKA